MEDKEAIEELTKIVNDEHQLDGYCASGLAIAKRVIKEGYRKSPSSGLEPLDEKEAIKITYRAVADASWEGKLNFRMPIQQVVELKPIVDYAVTFLCSKFGRPKLEQLDKKEITYNQEKEIARLTKSILERNEKKFELLDKEKVAKEMYEICCYPDPTPWEEVDQSVWLYRAGIFCDKFGRPKGLSVEEIEDIIERVISHCESMPKEYEAIQWFPKNTLAQALKNAIDSTNTQPKSLTFQEIWDIIIKWDGYSKQQISQAIYDAQEKK